MLQVLYLVHDVADPAVRRRVLMLKAGGADVTLAGFRRCSDRVAGIAGIVPIDLGQTHDADFGQRLLALISAAASLRSAFRGVRRPDLIIARNLEMLALARRAKAIFASADVPIAYECLDVHRLMLRADPLGKTMRAAERYLARDVRLLVTSSPAFIKEYFEPYGQVSAPVELLENKHFEGAARRPEMIKTSSRPNGPPWRIGWFGALRCAKSLGVLSAFARQQTGRFEITLRGRPALTAIPDFAERVEADPHCTFEGPYRNPEDIEAIYGAVHFSWVMDFFEEGQNSNWLLPNRLYEGCRFGAVPIALEGTETGRFLTERGIGIILPEASPEALERALGHIDATRLAILRDAVFALGRKTWACDHHDCKQLVSRLETLRAGATETYAGAMI